MRAAARLTAALAVAAVGTPAGAAAQEVRLGTEASAWEMAGDVTTGRVAGRDALLMRIGQAHRKGILFGDGTVELDVLLPDRRAFFGIKLRVQEDGTFEDFYLRAHKSGLADALQYNPSWKGIGQWQLYWNEHATAFADLPAGEWTRVRVEARGDRAALWVGDDPEPRLVVDSLRTGHPEGAFGFWANQPGAGADDPWSAAVSNVVVRPGVTSYDFPAAPAPATPAGTVTAWEVSEPWAMDVDMEIETLPAEASGPWQLRWAEPSGLLPFDRELARPGRPVAVLARLRLRADRDRTVRLDLGYSDEATVFLDGRPVWTGRNRYSYNLPRRQGLLWDGQASVHLPLRAGDNEVVVAVAEEFGGWGIMGRILDRTGITIVR